MDTYKCQICGSVFDEFEMNFKEVQMDKACLCKKCRNDRPNILTDRGRKAFFEGRISRLSIKVESNPYHPTNTLCNQLWTLGYKWSSYDN